MSGWGQRLVDQAWYGSRFWTLPLLPLSALLATVARRRLRQHRQRAGESNPPVPVIVVGNITAGGTGKTPLVSALARAARQRGLRPAIISRGYRARPASLPWLVTADQDSRFSGDEPLLLARETGVPVVIDPDRRRALEFVVSEFDADLVISDDGLQHYNLPRSYEIVVVDGQRGLGNGHCLPAGPLREPASRLDDVDMVVINGTGKPGISGVLMTLEPGDPRPLTGGAAVPLNEFLERHPEVSALAGIGNPQRFFAMLETLGFQVDGHPFADHHRFRPADLDFATGKTLLMTEKDAVKCAAFAGANHWVIPVQASLPDGILEKIFSEASG